MSAIFGLVNANKQQVGNTAQLMQNAMAHRATDGQGIYQDEQAFIATNQLITSVRQNYEKLPYQAENLVITCDSRIDNYRDIIGQLAIKGKENEITDAELIIKLYRKYGKKCIDYLEGEFAFVIWNKDTGTIFAATDHIGFRSFYYHFTGQAFVFASEIKGVLPAKQTPLRLDILNIINKYMINFDGGTYDTDIKQLPAGTTLTWQCSKPQTVELYKYWQLKANGKYAFNKDNEWAECMRELIINAVSKRLNSEKPVGISLSGGLDSSFLAGILATELQKKNKPLYTFSNVLGENYKGTEKDERYYIELVGKKYPNIQQHFIHFTDGEGPFSNMEDTFERIECLAYPFIYTDKRLFEIAGQIGTGLFFTGFGGDFAMSYKGGGLIYDQVVALRIRNAYKSLAFIAADQKISLLHAFRFYVLDNSPFRKLYQPVADYLRQDNAMLLSKELARMAAGKVAYGSTAGVKKRMADVINNGTIGGLLFKTQKKLSASYGIETTVPMLDKDLMEFFMDIPPEQFMLNNWQRSLMRRAMDGLVPEEIQWRKDKMAYVPDFPEKIMESRAFIDSILNHEKYGHARKAINAHRFKTMYELILNGKGNRSDSRILSWAVELVVFLQWLEEKEYNI